MPNSSKTNTATPPLVLASSSPRRQQILRQLGLPFSVIVPDVEELVGNAGLFPAELALENARLKAQAVADNRSCVIGADTVVTIDGICLGKPADLAEANAMLHRLSGRIHEVITGVALADPASGALVTFHVVTEVEFQPLDDAAITAYLGRIDPLDKAGGYAAQDHGHLIIRRINGPLDNVIGLPLAALANRLADLGYPIDPSTATNPSLRPGPAAFTP